MVAEGCVFTDGSVALRWRGNNPATAVWPDLESVLAVHGHQGATEVNWLETDPTTDLRFAPDPTERRLTPRPRPTPAEPNPSEDLAFSGEPGFTVAGEEPEAEFDLEQLFGEQHQVRPPSSVADPSGLPSAHARGWAAARHLR